MDDFAKERDEAFIDFVVTGNSEKLDIYCKKYRLPMPEKENVKAAGVYKAVQYCVSIPEDVKALALQKCVDMGFMPFIKPREVDE